ALAAPRVMPVASLGRLRERGRGGAGGSGSARATAVPVTAPGSPFAGLVANAAAGVVAGDAGPPEAAPASTGGITLSGGTSFAGMAGAPAAWPASPSTPARPTMTSGNVAAWAAATGALTGDLAAPPGDALEERLADILERAAAEAGIALP
ncbi:hypothetical protein GXW76_23955, partial [Roseomonas soli]|nr:hypothetical protein [Neoroseomonas soli]